MLDVEDSLLETRFPELRPQERRFVAMAASGCAMSVMAKNLNVTRMTLYNWLKKESVSTALQEIKSDTYSLGDGTGLLSEISTILMSIARSERAENRDRIRACQVLLHQASDFYQRRFVARRMDKLEARLLEAILPEMPSAKVAAGSKATVHEAFEDLEALHDPHYLPEGEDLE
jgi:hypothetical protein